jgi:glutamine---fructose-6-phosphate transaminase (isomerizing)
MCGIYGSIDQNGQAGKVVFAGLKSIEYRGYDSWGISYFFEDGLQESKDVGFLPGELTLPKSKIAIGHTRWATHGGVTRANAHPHFDCLNLISVVHNGIVENAAELITQLHDQHLFKSQTDTEVIAHLIEEEMMNNKLNLAHAVEVVFGKLKGANAILVSDGYSVVAARNGSSLVVGKTKTGYVVSSDPMSLLTYTNQLHVLADNEIVLLNEETTSVEFETVNWKQGASELGEHAFYMIKEISEQPDALQKLLVNTDQISNAANLILQAKNIFMLGCGSAYYAGLAGESILSKYSNLLCHTYAASEFESKLKHVTPADLIVAISQSGETIDLLDPIRNAQKSGISVLGITNRFGSALFREVPDKIMLDAGEEKAVVATKSFTNMVASFILLAFELSSKPAEGHQIINDNITEIIDVIGRSAEIARLAKSIAHCPHIFVLGKDLLHPIALEIALKIKESTYLHAEGFQGGELKHGVLALIEEGVPVIVLTPSDSQKTSIMSNIAEVKARGARVLGIGPENNKLYDDYFSIKPVGADAMLAKAVFGQMLSYYISLERGLNPDKPRNLAKSVTTK